MDYLKFAIRLDVILSIALNLIVLIIIGMGSYFIISDKFTFTIGDLSTFIAFFSTLVWPMMAIAQLINLVAQGKASLKRVSALLEEEITVKDSHDVLSVDSLQGKITFNHLSFAYPNSENLVLNDVTFSIIPGEKIGIIGKTGCGKSTLVNLLLRMYNVDENQLLIDDFDIMKLPIVKVRELMSFVPQDNFLFGMSVNDNIRFGIDGEISKEQIIEVAEYADIDENIMGFINGYETLLGERGVTISGGQKQRLSIARALLRKTPILILDDAVSAVDTKTELKILENLKKHFSNSTVILIAHRISTVQNMDKILLMDEGKVVGFAPHEELYEKSSLYQEMVELQKLEAKIEGEQDE